jgi:hypothetical protein
MQLWKIDKKLINKLEQRGRTEMATDKVRKYLKPLGRDVDVLEFDTSSATVEMAAEIQQSSLPMMNWRHIQIVRNGLTSVKVGSKN